MFIMNAVQDLTLKNSLYQKALELYVKEAYEQDLGEGGDITTQYFLTDPKQEIQANITASTSGIFAGLQEVKWLLDQLSLKINSSQQDGQPLTEGVSVLTFTGPAGKVLAVERTVLNILQRMSGIATYTSFFRQKMTADIQLLATRKTLWGLLDKRAVALGGGGTHRLNLSDAILIKDNHLTLNLQWPETLFDLLSEKNEARFIELEIDTLLMAEQALTFFAQLPAENKTKAIVMLDNFTPEQVKLFAPQFAQQGIVVEVSGGINEANVHFYLLPGVSAISTSALTLQAHSLDMSMEVNPKS